MLYIEDFLELIEPFPQEIRERLTEMRETDLQIQNETDKLDERIKIFFQQCKKQKPEWKNQNYEEIRTEYSKLLESADDKVQITNQLYELIEKYLKKLDQELQKFKLELEADHAGITSKLEQVISSSIHENNLNVSDSSNVNANYSSNSYLYNSEKNSDFSLTSTNNELMKMMAGSDTNNKSGLNTSHKRKNSQIMDRGKLEDDESNSSWNSKLEGSSFHSSSSSNPTFHFSNTNKKSAMLLNKKNLKPGQSTSSSSLNKLIRSNSISMQSSSTKQRPSNRTPKSLNKSEKSQRIKKTKLIDLDYDDEADLFENDGMRHDSLRLDDPNSDLYTNDLNEETSETTGTSENDLVQLGRLLNNDDEFESDNSSENEMDTVNSNMDNEDTTNSDLETKLKLAKRNQNMNHFKEEWNSGEDTNERYCVCKDISYGDMIMCDNSRCETQWFHFVCVGLNAAPKGKWFCPFCVDSKKKKKEKQLNSTLSTATASGAATTTATANPSLLNTINKLSQQTNFSSSDNPFLSASSSFTTSFK